ncbi:tetratricopeptide repeat protein [candidate division WOR-3 bacterium]|nr:tetratricopeptide repeat protein [candidate division WOR-3 bacterium]
MKSNSIPGFISEKMKAKEMFGTTRGSALFTDLGGFTKMTEMFFKKGDSGAEEISKQLLWVFDMPIKTVHKYGGHVTTFAGDAFTAIFPGDDGKIAYSVAVILTYFFEREGKRKTDLGDLNFTCKCGVGTGDIDWRIISLDSKLNSYLFTGQAISLAITNAEGVGTGEIGREGALKTVMPQASFRTYSVPDDILSKFVPEYIVKAGERGELRHATPVFIKIDEKDTVVQDEAFRKIYELAEYFGGCLNKIDYGDKGIVALVLFGAPEAKENPEDLAVRFSVGMKEAGFNARIGIDTGLVYAGMTGGTERAEWTCLGNVVNTSARIMSACEEKEILASERVKTRTEKGVCFRFHKEEVFKGKASPEKIYSVESLNETRSLAFKYKMVGRENELNELKEFSSCILTENKNAGVCYIYGEAGIGKSRLAWELIEQMKQEGVDLTVMHLQCEETSRYPWFPVSQWLLDFLKLEKSILSYEELKNSVEDLQIQLLPKHIKPIADIIGFPSADSAYEKQSEDRKKENQIFALKEFVKAMSRKKPMVILVDDLNNIDELTIEWLSAVTRNVLDYPFAVICTSRFDEKGSRPRINLDRRVNTAEIDLHSFESRELISKMFSQITGLSPSEGTEKYLFENTQGNPFFLEQTIVFLKEQNMLNGTPVEISGKIERLPDSLCDLLTARLDSMDFELREIIKKAAVIGERFLVEILRSIIEEDIRDELEFFLDKGEQGQIIARELNYEDIYMFRHAMLREAAYQLYLPSERKKLHKRIFEFAENRLSKELEIHTKLLVEQSEKAEEWDKWAEYAEKYMKVMLRKGANLELLRICMRLSKYHKKEGNNQKAAETELTEGRILKKTGRHKEAREKISRATKYFEKLGAETLLADANNELGTSYLGEREFDTALCCFQKALEYSEKTGEKTLRCRTLGNMGVLFASMKSFDKALSSYENAMKLALEIGDKKFEALALSNIGAILAQQKKYEEAEICFNKSYEIALKYGINEEKAGAQINLGNLEAIKGRILNAEKHFMEALKIFREAGIREGEASSLYNISEMKKHEDKFDEAWKFSREYLELAKETGNINWEIKALSQTGDLKYRMSDPEDAVKYYNEALKLCEIKGDKTTETEILFEIAKLYRRIKDFSKSHDYLDRAFEKSGELGNPDLRSDIAYNIACLFADCGSFKKAGEYLDVLKKAGDKEGKIKAFREKYGY